MEKDKLIMDRIKEKRKVYLIMYKDAINKKCLESANTWLNYLTAIELLINELETIIVDNNF